MAYIFGITVMTIYIYVAFIARTMKRDRYKFRILLGIISLFFGLVVDYYRVFDKPFGLFTIFGISPLIYLACYEIFRRLYKPWIGEYPYSPYREKIGDKVQGKGYPIKRVITGNDYIFGMSMLFVPIITLVILIVIIGL